MKSIETETRKSSIVQNVIGTKGKLRPLIALLASAGTLAMAVLAYASSSTQVEQLAPLAVPRTAHTATVLADGSVLITGGRDAAGTALAVAEIFDPKTKTSKAIGDLVTARTGHTATLLKDGRVLVAGGTNATGTLASAEIFEPLPPSSGFHALDAAMGAPRTRHTATLLNDGKVLLAGGDSAGSAEIFDPATETFSVTLLSMVYPEEYSVAQKGAEPCSMQTEVLVRTQAPDCALNISVRFLHPMAREVGVLDEPVAELSLKTEPKLHLVNEQLIGEKHRHGDYVHTHPHGHAAETHGHSDETVPPARLDRIFGGVKGYRAVRPIVIGIVHGLAGSAAVALLVLPIIQRPLWAIAYLFVFGLGTIAGMMLMTATIAVPITYSTRFNFFHRHFGTAAGALSVCFGLFLCYQIGFVQGLFTH